MYEVFEQLLLKFKVSAVDVCNATGIGQSTISNWKSRRNLISGKNAKLIADYFGVSVDFLMTGKEKEGVETYFANEETSKIAKAIFSNEDLRKLFDVSKDMTPEQIRAFTAMIDAMITKEKKSNQTD